jgi:hypothetical protein
VSNLAEQRDKQTEGVVQSEYIVHTGAEQALKAADQNLKDLEEQVKEEYVKVQGRLIELVAIQKVKPLSPVELKEMEDIIVLVNYIEEDLSNSAGEVPPSKEGLKMKIPYVTPDVRLEHELKIFYR